MKNNKLRELRLKKGLSQEYIALELNISQKAYSNIENGKVCLNTVKLNKISKILDINPSKICLNSCECNINQEILESLVEFVKKENVEIPKFIQEKINVNI